MSIKEKRLQILRHIDAHRENLLFNNKIFDILEGRLIDLVEESLHSQLSAKSFTTAMERVSPINVFRKATNKRSTLYTDNVSRSTEIESDQDLVRYYEQNMAVDSYFEDANKGFNAYKYTVLEFYQADGKLKTRQLPSHHFLPYGDDPRDPLKVTAMIKFMGNYMRYDGKEVERYWVYSNDEFMSIDSEGDFVIEDMEENEGINELGVIPFVYINKSRSLLVPYPDKDDLAISILVPVLLTDLNFAAKFLAHSVFYGIDVDINEMQLSPDSVWIFKSDQEGNKPEIGTIKPEVSIEDVLKLASEQLMAWLDTKNVKTKSMGQVTANNVSGISKIIDEADTTLDRKQQMRIFKAAEVEYWQKLAKIHNVLADAREISNTAKFSNPEELIVSVEYSEQKVIENRIDVVNRLKEEVGARFRSRRSAIKELFPKLDTEDLDKHIEEIDEEGVFEIEQSMDESEG